MNTMRFSAEHTESLLRAHALGTDPEASGPGLADFLYARWYTASSTRIQHETEWPPLEGMLRVSQGEALGWRSATVVRRGASGVVVTRDDAGRTRALLRGGYGHSRGDERTGLPPEAGEVLVAVPRSGGVVSEGWWRAWGGGWDPRTAPEGTVRIYLRPHVMQLPSLVGCLTATLEGRAEPWTMKVTADAANLGRPDAVVVYLTSRAAFDDIVACSLGHVRSEPGPPLAAPLAPGVAWADDPGDGQSFGESRCALVAVAMEAAGGQDEDVFLQTVWDTFVAAGLDPSEPNLRGVVHG